MTTERMRENIEKHARRIYLELRTQRGAKLVTSDEDFARAVMARVREIAAAGGEMTPRTETPT